MNPALWGMLTALGWGSADFIARFSGRALGPERSLFGMLAVGSAVGFATTLFVAREAVAVYGQIETVWLTRLVSLSCVLPILLLRRRLPRVPARPRRRGPSGPLPRAKTTRVGPIRWEPL